MAERTSGGLYNRRALALTRLQTQLKSGNKTVKTEVVDLTDGDIKRINKEVAVLTERTK